MAVSFFSRINSETKGEEEEERVAFHSSYESSSSIPSPPLVRPRRKQTFQVGTLVTLLLVFAIWTISHTCSYVIKKAVRGSRHETLGRRLAAGGEEGNEEEEQDLLAQILSECLGWQEGLEGTVDPNAVGGEGQPQAQPLMTPTQQLQQVMGELPPGEGPPSSACASQIADTALPDLQVVPMPPPVQGDQSFFQQLPPEAFLEDALQFLAWVDETESSAQPSTTQDPVQPGPSTLETGTKRSISPVDPDESPPSKKRKAPPKQSLGGMQDGALSATTGAYVTSDATAGVEHTYAKQQPGAFSFQAPLTTEQAAPSLGDLGPTAPSTSSESPGATVCPLPPPAPVMPHDTHLYYRLPILWPGTAPRTFNLARAFDPMSGVTAYPHLRTIRYLLTQATLHPSNAEPLFTACEEIVSHLFRFHRNPLNNKRPAAAAYLLSRRYLCFDAIFTVVQLLGPAALAEQWWPKLVESIPTDYTRPIDRRGNAPAATVLSDELALRLSAALAQLKKGIRPSEEETVQLKRALFFNKVLRLKLKDPKWDPWRKDDNDGGEGTSHS
ncbi:hypothetical protein Emed_003322 [Eimeria media]